MPTEAFTVSIKDCEFCPLVQTNEADGEPEACYHDSAIFEVNGDSPPANCPLRERPYLVVLQGANYVQDIELPDMNHAQYAEQIKKLEADKQLFVDRVIEQKALLEEAWEEIRALKGSPRDNDDDATPPTISINPDYDPSED